MLFIDPEPDQPHWGWSWMDRWMAARPWENQNLDPLKDGCSQAIPSMKSSLEARTKHVDKHVVIDSGTGDMRLKVGGGGKSSTKKGEEKQHKDPLPLPSPPCLPAAISMAPKGPTSTEQTTTLPMTAAQMLPLSADASFSLAVDGNTGVTLPPPPEHLSSLKVPLPSDDLLPSETYALKNMTTNGVTSVHISMGCNGAGEHQEDKSAGKVSLQQSPAGNQPLCLKTHHFLIFTQALNLWVSVRRVNITNFCHLTLVVQKKCEFHRFRIFISMSTTTSLCPGGRHNGNCFKKLALLLFDRENTELQTEISE
jgi:hypothetical protein